MKFLFTPDSSRGTLLSERITALLEESTGRIFPGYEAAGASVAGGGEGAIDTVTSVLNGTYRRLAVHGPLIEEYESFYGEFEEDGAIIEMAAVSGLPMAPAEKRNPLNTTTYRTGELIRGALDREYRKISIAIGGSATNDGGMGAMHTLGVKFLDDRENELEGKEEDLTRVVDIVMSGLHHGVAQAKFTVMCDATNPLAGLDGATYIFGKQKGGIPEILDIMGGGMIRYAALIKERLGVGMDKIPRSEIADGSGTAFCVFLGANLRSGIDIMLDLVHFNRSLEGVDLVVTGEDGIDWQFVFGKAPSGVGRQCRERGILVVTIVGGMGCKVETIFDHDVDSIMTTASGAIELEEALDRSEELYVSAADRMFRMLEAGMSFR